MKFLHIKKVISGGSNGVVLLYSYGDNYIVAKYGKKAGSLDRDAEIIDTFFTPDGDKCDGFLLPSSVIRRLGKVRTIISPVMNGSLDFFYW
jgi:hypothetical protein